MAKSFVFDANAVLTLGRNSIKDHTTAVVELVKNAYDADADTVEVEIVTEFGDARVRISDNGHGMSDDDIVAKWLRIGFSDKVTDTTSKKFQRRKTGEKGIGRLSADRLGSILELRTLRQGFDPAGIVVDWREFEKSGRDARRIVIPEIEDPKPTVPRRRVPGPRGAGTELVIRNPRQKWTKSDVRKLHMELSLLLPPYRSLSRNFLLKFNNDVDPTYNGPVTFGGGAQGELELTAKIDEHGNLAYRLEYYDVKDRTKRWFDEREMSWVEIAPDPVEEKRPRGKKRLPTTPHRAKAPEAYRLGPIEIKLSYFVRRVELLEGTGLSMSQLRKYLSLNSGVRIYRDFVRVKPYGDPGSPEADWLQLGDRKLRDPAGARRETFKISPTQLVGGVFAGRDLNPTLIDSSSREGLIENEAFHQLKGVLYRCISLLEAKYHSLSVETDRPKTSATKAKAAVKSLAGNLSTLSVDLIELQSKVSSEVATELKSVAEHIGTIVEQAQATSRNIDELADQNTVYRGLATLGIASAIFGHETSLAVTQASMKVSLAQKSIGMEPPRIARAEEHLLRSREYLSRIATWGKFSLQRVNKDKRQRKKVSISSLVTAIVDDMEPPISESQVEIRRSIADGIEARTFPMDVEAVLINFLTNSYHEVKRHQGPGVIRVRLIERQREGEAGFEISVSDNGSGVAPELVDAIWEPLFSTKIDSRGKSVGTGLGLAIVKSAVEELGGEVSVSRDSQLEGAIFGAWFPKG